MPGLHETAEVAAVYNAAAALVEIVGVAATLDAMVQERAPEPPDVDLAVFIGTHAFTVDPALVQVADGDQLAAHLRARVDTAIHRCIDDIAAAAAVYAVTRTQSLEDRNAAVIAEIAGQVGVTTEDLTG